MRTEFVKRARAAADKEWRGQHFVSSEAFIEALGSRNEARPYGDMSSSNKKYQ